MANEATSGAPSIIDAKRLIKLLIGIAVCVGISLLPPPEAMTVASMRFLGIFVMSLIWLLTSALPDVAIVIIMMVLLLLTNCVDSFGGMFSAFSGDIVWMVIGAMTLGIGIANSGLLKRICLAILDVFPANFKGQVLAFFIAGTVTNVAIPSPTAKASLLAPFAKNISDLLGYEKNSKGSAGIFTAAYIPAANNVMMVLTGSAMCLVLLGFMPAETAAAYNNYFAWLKVAGIWGIIVLVICFILTIIFFKPKNDVTMDKAQIGEMRAELGKVTTKEIIAGVITLLAIVAWITQSIHGVSATVVALAAASIMFVFNLVTPRDFVTRIPWTLIVFVGAFIGVSGLFSSLGVSTWLSGILGPVLAPVFNNVFVTVLLLAVIVWAVRFVVNSQLAVYAIFIPIIIPLAAASGIDPFLVGFCMLAFQHIYPFKFSNTNFMAMDAASGGEMISNKDTLLSSIIWMIATLAACLICLPIWGGMGMF